MSFGKTSDRRRQAAKKHTEQEHVCHCGKRIRGNAYYRHRQACPTYRAAKEALREAARGGTW